jgi:hypothetical protein
MYRQPVNVGLCRRLCLNIFNNSETAVSQLNSCWHDRQLSTKSKSSYVMTDGQPISLSWSQAPCGAPSQMRGWVCHNCCWPSPAQSFSRTSSAWLMTIFYSQIWDSPNLEGQVPVFISPKNRVAQHFFYGCMCIHWHGYVFIELLPSNGCLLQLSYQNTDF